MSGLFWWSTVNSSIGWPRTEPPKSAIAICRFDAVGPMHVGVGAGHVVDVADDDLFGGAAAMADMPAASDPTNARTCNRFILDSSLSPLVSPLAGFGRGGADCSLLRVCADRGNPSKVGRLR